MNKSNCNGCYNNFYNGNNGINVKECFNFKDPILVKKIKVGYWEPPPYKNRKLIEIPNCYNEGGSNRSVYVAPEKLTKEGFWK